ncbi:TPA_asm: VanZ family protein [Listeria monocytogenes]|uniref:VanZ family protein n=1 Tax=Listeria monocytogenes TaxID=1639 RepID=A0AAN3BIS8_LISMN|nr:VanZ family protein [Listeria monocytogenes]EHC6229732.1 VanZ family protein [Listeria monocytogenes serotype 1/2a]EAC3771267.1 VanZ family protein [Listeria monocytogenes]EAC7071262.1 VanZ family protein [Listeria monocytogenes]EAD8309065.1 VanZ family protein [Listeria monocytogenes]EAE1487027.1 VanZ family protein [Listeria monocytogenes]
MTTIPISIPMTLIVICIFELVYFGTKKFIIKSPFNKKETLINVIFVAYLAVLIEVVLLPFNIVTSNVFREIFPLEAYLQIIPFKSIIFYLSHMTNYHIMIQFFGNLLLLAPLAIYLNINRSISLVRNLILALCISLFIEVLQGILNIIFQYPNNVSDIDDLILNIIGYMCALLLVPWFKKIFKSKNKFH